MRQNLKMTVWILALLAIVACSEPSSIEEGEASYYADSLHGNQTASGETYNRSAYTAAHLTLAFDTRVRVTNLGNGKSVWVTINDRGPYADNRIIDLSRAAARKLDMLEAGTTQVRLEIYE